jgi:hypothetical protein
MPSFGYGYGYYGYYGRAYDTIYTPGYITEDTIVKLETTVYDSKTEKMVWAGGTRSFNPSSAKKGGHGKRRFDRVEHGESRVDALIR